MQCINLPFSLFLIRNRHNFGEWKKKADAEVNHRIELEETVIKRRLSGLISI